MTVTAKQFPAFYEAERVGQLYLPRMGQAAEAGQKAGLSQASQDQNRVMLLLIDAQIDFIFPEGTLPVPGAVEDTRRTIEWIYRHAGELTAISASLDSHTAYQIFSPSWWVNEQGQHPDPYTTISSADLESGKWRPLLEPAWSRDYVARLEQGGKYDLMIWPYHTMIGTPGNALVPALAEAIMYHAAARQAQPNWLIKGTIPQTENYSIMEPEIKIAGNPVGELNTGFLNTLAQYDRVYVAGQAKSHCVLSTMRSIMDYFASQPATLAKFYLLTDCTSSVQHPEIDFDKLATEEYHQMERQGLHLVLSTDPIA